MPAVIFFSCKKCGVINQRVLVKPRNPTESIVGWMDRCVKQQIHHQHTLRSLLCEESHFDLVFPVLKEIPNCYIGYNLSDEQVAMLQPPPSEGDERWKPLDKEQRKGRGF